MDRVECQALGSGMPVGAVVVSRPVWQHVLLDLLSIKYYGYAWHFSFLQGCAVKSPDACASRRALLGAMVSIGLLFWWIVLVIIVDQPNEAIDDPEDVTSGLLTLLLCAIPVSWITCAIRANFKTMEILAVLSGQGKGWRYNPILLLALGNWYLYQVVRRWQLHRFPGGEGVPGSSPKARRLPRATPIPSPTHRPRKKTRWG